MSYWERRIVSAAQRNSAGRVLMSVRHMDHNFWRAVLGLPDSADLPVGTPFPEAIQEWQGAEQGFVDNRGNFLTREEAWPIAMAARQVNVEELRQKWQIGCLHSEHLY